jgi:hypothetical protein
MRASTASSCRSAGVPLVSGPGDFPGARTRPELGEDRRPAMLMTLLRGGIRPSSQGYAVMTASEYLAHLRVCQLTYLRRPLGRSDNSGHRRAMAMLQTFSPTGGRPQGQIPVYQASRGSGFELIDGQVRAQKTSSVGTGTIRALVLSVEDLPVLQHRVLKHRPHPGNNLLLAWAIQELAAEQGIQESTIVDLAEGASNPPPPAYLRSPSSR